MTKIAIVIPAAGASRRMAGRDKLLEPVDGSPLLFGIAQRAVQVSDAVFVTLPSGPSLRRDTIADLAATPVEVPDAQSGMSASLRRVLPYLPDELMGVMVLPADMPDIRKEHLEQMIRAFRATEGDTILQATSETGVPGHPVIFPAALATGFARLSGDTGARSILKANLHRVRRVALPKDVAITDLDTPDAWAAWRAQNPDR
ncbi:NTP transferase domain-containing protein [Marivita sp. S0852]|uniref:nucleotidyltransferase family protein n=1 Tax=Marivita sp. S0852 TaxID=3373893 RepID=UPI00398254D5